MSEKLENPGECECCGYATKKLRYFEKLPTTIAGGGRVREGDFWYCELCCSTPASNADRYPGQYADTDAMKTICYVGNVLLAAIKAKSRR